MNIAVLGKFSVEEMGSHISQTLNNMGHNIYEVEYGPELNQNKNNQQDFLMKLNIHAFNFGANLNRKTRTYMMKQIIRKLTSITDLDVVISTHDWLTSYEIEAIKRNTNSKIILWFPDGIINFGRAYFMTAGYDYIFFKDQYIVKNLRSYYGFENVYYLPEAFNPEKHKPVRYNEDDNKKYKCDISMVGNLHSHRIPILEKLVSEGKYNIKLYGGRAPFYTPISDNLNRCYTNQFVGDEIKSKAMIYSKIALNTLHVGEVESANVRVFEIAGIGAFQLTAYRQGLEELFEIGKEIETYSSYGELVEKIDYYLFNEEKRREISKNGYLRAIKDHTYEARLTKMLEIIS
jgi:spore maturation protein CgeB